MAFVFLFACRCPSFGYSCLKNAFRHFAFPLWFCFMSWITKLAFVSLFILGFVLNVFTSWLDSIAFARALLFAFASAFWFRFYFSAVLWYSRLLLCLPFPWPAPHFWQRRCSLPQRISSPYHYNYNHDNNDDNHNNNNNNNNNNKELTLTLLCSLPPTPSRQQPQKTKGKQTMKMVFLICKMFASYMLTVPFILWLQFLANFGLFWTESIGVMVNFPRYSFPAAHGGTSKEECIICFETLESRPTGYTACGVRSIILILRDDPLLCY